MGKIIALSILHGGPGPVFFSSAVVDYLFGGIATVRPSIDDIPDQQVQAKIRNVSEPFITSIGGLHYRHRRRGYMSSLLVL